MPQYAPPAKIPPEPVSFAAGRYQVRKLLGEGGKKRVYLVHDSVLDRDVAFAQIKTERLDEDARTRIKREAQAMGRLGEHPNIVSVYDFGDDEGWPFMVLPLLSGGDVQDLIERAPDHRLPLDKAIGIAKGISNGLVFAHSKGIIHRDLKPGKERNRAQPRRSRSIAACLSAENRSCASCSRHSTGLFPGEAV